MTRRPSPRAPTRETDSRIGICRDGRAQANVVGFALLVGLTVVGVTGVVVLGAQGLGSLQNETTAKQAEHAFTQLDSVGAEVALGQSEARTVDLGTRGGSLRTVPAGELRLAYEDGPTIHAQTLGAVVHERDGAVVAYQGGGVWRGTGNESRMVSPPEIHFHDGTLTMPMVVVRAGGSGPNDRVTVRRLSQQPNLGPGTVRNDVVVLTITSDYYVGWAQYFETRVDDVHVSVDHGARTATIELGRVQFDATFDDAIQAHGGDVEVSTGNPEVNGPITAEGSISEAQSGSISGDTTAHHSMTVPAVDKAVQQKVSNAPGDPDVTTQQIAAGQTLTSGTYYDPDGFTLGGTTTVDLAGGNVTLLVDGDVNVHGGELRVENAANGRLQVLTTGDLSLKNGKMYVAPNDPNDVEAEKLVVFGESDMQVAMVNGGSYFEGVIYAPRESDAPGVNDAMPTSQSQCEMSDGTYADTCLGTGSLTVDGAIVGGQAAIKQKTTVNYDADLDGLTITLNADEVLAPELTYLHLSVNEIAIEGGSVVGSTATPTATPTTPTATPTPTPSPGDEEPEVDVDSVEVDEYDTSPGNGNTKYKYDVTVDWDAVDEDDDLDTVEFTVEDLHGGCGVTTITKDVSGGSAVGVEDLTFGSYSGPSQCTPGDEYAVTITATDENGNTDSESESETA
ncbi:DUF7289 family protein [Salinigranum salinum]|uniref:DUF7289 family protein n=1 Tax=Salinigranum salinum TaxID=1364937 RepID=UPI001260DB96|nr:hypothetical protein [Salinigranum salinum]